MNNGLFQVTDRIYQVRGFDISNMTFIEGNRGLIVIDPLVSDRGRRRRPRALLAHRGRKPVTAVIYTHTHVDHFGGVRGVVDEADVKAGHVAIIAPDASWRRRPGERPGRHADDPPRHVPVRRPAARKARAARSMRASARSSRAARSR